MSHKATSWLSSLPPDMIGNSEFRVLFHLCDCHNPSAGCFPTQKYLMDACNISNSTLNTALNGLEAKVLITRHRKFDGTTKRQKPTHYILGFEMDGKQGPTPKTGDGNKPDPTPKTGGGADSGLRGDPTPISGGSRLRQAGEVTCKEPVINQRAGARGSQKKEKTEISIIENLARYINEGRYVSIASITIQQAQEMLRRNLVTEDQLRARGIHF